ncbi:hypothetical protein Sango_0799400 [Sesamum angolense]|uniref:Retrovirus-related Pol polyprotein from transposon TNT 1-94-like beta-barrel domain-containing protein n=1 Tax=Sesamum angolense TaxID=2727404 RepID=A0AAE1X3P9_9LAMI|nr:hypothetical protein Sango_0799400 [Sesamum angolense]
MIEGSSVQSHGVKMLSLVEKFEDLKAGLDNDTYIDVTLQPLLPSYNSFIINYNMNGLEKSIHELINMLVQYEATTHKSASTILVGEVLTSKAESKRAGCWKRKKGKRKVTTATTSAEGGPTTSSGKSKGKGKDTGFGDHICNNLQVLERRRKLSKDEMILRLGDGKAVAVEAVGSLNLVISDHIQIELKDCYYGPSMIKNIISIPILDNYGYAFKINKNCFYLRIDDNYHLLDVCGPLNTPTRGGFSYFITFTDAHSRYDYVYLMSYKSEAFGKFKEYRLEVENQTGHKIKALRDMLLRRLPSCSRWRPLRWARGERIHLTTQVDFEETYLPVAMAKSIQILLAIAAWLDVAYALSAEDGHWSTVKIILKYLRRTKDMFLIYGSG